MKSIKREHNSGFTLIELLVVIAIVGILSSVVLSSVSSMRDQATETAVKSTLDKMSEQVALERLQNSSFTQSDLTTPGYVKGDSDCGQISGFSDNDKFKRFCRSVLNNSDQYDNDKPLLLTVDDTNKLVMAAALPDGSYICRKAPDVRRVYEADSIDDWPAECDPTGTEFATGGDGGGEDEGGDGGGDGGGGGGGGNEYAQADTYNFSSVNYGIPNFYLDVLENDTGYVEGERAEVCGVSGSSYARISGSQIALEPENFVDDHSFTYTYCVKDFVTDNVIAEEEVSVQVGFDTSERKTNFAQNDNVSLPFNESYSETHYVDVLQNDNTGDIEERVNICGISGGSGLVTPSGTRVRVTQPDTKSDVSFTYTACTRNIFTDTPIHKSTASATVNFE